MSHRACRDEGINRAQTIFAGLVIAGLVLAGIAPALAQEEKSGEVESRGMPRLQRPMKPGMPAQPGAPGQPNAQLPTWPQKFDVQGPESDSFGFAVTQPGPVVVDVQVQGAPVIVTLQGPAPQPISQQGTGQIRLTYNATPQDVQKSVLWGIQIRLAQPAPPQQGGRAGGMVMVQYPPVNQAVVQQAVQAMAAQQTQPSAQEQQQAAAQAVAQMESAFQQRKAQFNRQQMDRRGTLDAQIRPQLDQLRSRMGGQVRPRGLEGSEGTSGEPGALPEGEIGTRALRGDQMIGIMQQPLDAATMPRMPQTAMPSQPPTASSAQPLQSAGSGPGPQSVMPNPVIASLSVTQGQPGDPVMINGSGFGNDSGEVHFVLGPNKDVPYQGQTWWNDNQILVNVPEVTGLRAYNGFVYLIRNSDKSKTQLTPFRFEPAQEYRSIIYTQDKQIGWPNFSFDFKILPIMIGIGATNIGHHLISHRNSNPFFGYKGNDEFFTNSRLSNDWILDEVYLTPTRFFMGGAYIQEKKIGTNWPYFNIRFWVDGNFSGLFVRTESASEYIYLVSIKGPKGVPDGIVVP